MRLAWVEGCDVKGRTISVSLRCLEVGTERSTGRPLSVVSLIGNVTANVSFAESWIRDTSARGSDEIGPLDAGILVAEGALRRAGLIDGGTIRRLATPF